MEWINEDTIASSGYDKTIQIWSISTGSIQRIINLGNQVLSLKILSNGLYLACGTANGLIEIFNIHTGDLISTLRGHRSFVNDLTIINNSINIYLFQMNTTTLLML